MVRCVLILVPRPESGIVVDEKLKFVLGPLDIDECPRKYDP